MRKSVKNKLVYRLRNKGYQVDTPNKIIYAPKDTESPLAKRLVDEFGFTMSERMFDEKTGGRVLVLYGEDYDITTLRWSGYVPVSCRNDRFEDWVKSLLKCDVVYLGIGWDSDEKVQDYLLLAQIAKKLNKKITFV